MSNALAIAGVTAVIRDLLNDGIINHDISGTISSKVLVSALPPDRVVSAGTDEASQLNIFLHQVTPNTGWRNNGLPSVDESGKRRLSNPALALDLHYLISAYSAADLHGDILVGYAAQLLHEHPILSRGAIKKALDPSPNTGSTLPPLLRNFADCGLAEQIELIKIVPEYLSTDDLSKLWSATQSSIRPSVAFQATVVLIEAQKPVRKPLPVLSRGPVDPASNRDRGVVVQANMLPPYPCLTQIRTGRGNPTVVLGEEITLEGFNLNGQNRQIVLTNAQYGIEQTVSPTAGSTDTQVKFNLPTNSSNFSVGVYDVRLRVQRPNETEVRTTNRVTLHLVPELQLPSNPDPVPRNNGVASFAVAFTPALREGQIARLVLGGDEYVPQPPGALPTTSLAFAIRFTEPSQPAGLLARLRIDDHESSIIDPNVKPPVFLDKRIRIT